MKSKEVFHLDGKKYMEEKSSIDYLDEMMVENIHRKRRQVAASGWTITANSLLIAPSHGASLIGLGWGLRKLSVESRKLLILDKVWEERGNSPVPHDIVFDYAIPILAAAAVTGVSFGVNAELGALGVGPLDNAGEQGGEYIASAILHGQGLPSDAATVFGHAVVHEVKETLTGFVGSHPHVPCPFSPADRAVNAIGEAVGAGVAERAGNYAINNVIDPTRNYQDSRGALNSNK